MGNLLQELTADGDKFPQTGVSKEGISDLLWLWSRATSPADLWKQIEHGTFLVKTLNVNEKFKKKKKKEDFIPKSWEVQHLIFQI